MVFYVLWLLKQLEPNGPINYFISMYYFLNFSLAYLQRTIPNKDSHPKCMTRWFCIDYTIVVIEWSLVVSQQVFHVGNTCKFE